MTTVTESLALSALHNITEFRDNSIDVTDENKPLEDSLHQVLISLQDKACSLLEKKTILQRNWDDICNSLGAHRVIEEFCPYLEEITRTILAFSLPGIVEFFSTLCDCLEKSLHFVGGPLHVEPLLSILALICGSENVQVRKKATSCLQRLVIATAHYKESLDILTKFLCSLMASENGYIQSASCYVFEAMIKAKAFDLLPSLADSFLRDYLKLYVARKELVRRELITTLPGVLQLISNFFLSQKQEKLETNASNSAVHSENFQLTEPYGKIENIKDNCVEKDSWKNTLLTRIPEALEELARDNSVSVRIAMASTIISMISETYSNEKAYKPWKNQLHELLLNFLQDPSWMVRYTVAKKILPLILQDYNRFGIEFLHSFLNDAEIEVRIGFLDSLAQLEPGTFARFLTIEQQSELLERFRTKIKNDYDEVFENQESINSSFDPLNNEFFAESRKKFDWIDRIAKNLIPFANLFTTSLSTIALFPTYTDFLKQSNTQIQLTTLASLLPRCCHNRLIDFGQSNSKKECDSDDLDLQQQIVHKCEHALVDFEATNIFFSPVANKKKQPFLLSSIQHYLLIGIFQNGSNIAENGLKSTIKDANWRLRQSTLLVFTNLFQFIKTTPPEKLQYAVLEMVLTCLEDEACSVRSVAAVCAGYLGCTNFEWTKTLLIPKLIALAKHPNYLYRLSISRSLISLLFYLINPLDLSETYNVTEFFEIITKPSKLAVCDLVENVRTHFLRCLINLMSSLDSKNFQEFKEYCIIVVREIFNTSTKQDSETENLVSELNSLCE